MFFLVSVVYKLMLKSGLNQCIKSVQILTLLTVTAYNPEYKDGDLLGWSGSQTEHAIDQIHTKLIT